MKSLFSLCEKYIQPRRGLFTLYILLCIFLSLQSIASPYITGSFIDYLTSGSGINLIVHYCTIFVALTLSGLLIGYISNRLYIRLQTTISYELNKDVLCHLQKVSFAFIKNQDTVALNQRINNDSNSIISFYVSLFQNIVINIVVIVSGFILIFRFDFVLAGVLFVLVPCYFVVYQIFKHKLFNHGLALKKSQTEYFAKLNEQLTFIKQVKMFSLFETFTDRLNDVFVKTLANALKYQTVSYSFSSVDTIILTVAQVFLFLYGGAQVINAKLTIGHFTIISSYFSMMLTSVRYFLSLGKDFQDAKTAYCRLNDVLNIPCETVGTEELQSIDRIDVQNLSLKENGKAIVSGLNATFVKDRIYVIRGLNGAGKSTLLNLIMGLYVDCFEGRILFNQLPMEKLNMYALRKSKIGILEQNPTLFEDTVDFNIFLTKLGANGNAIDRLIDVTELNSFIAEREEGLQTVLAENSATISGGERQKIALLRALLSDPDLLLLDEPTSSLDFPASKKLQEYLVSVKMGRIIIIVTHDDMFAEVADETIFIEAGKDTP